MGSQKLVCHSASMDVEGVLLTGGASRRMGEDKASILIEGTRLAERIARELDLVCTRVTVLGRAPVTGFQFLPDAEEFEGPLAALSKVRPLDPFVFVASCDLPCFRSETILRLRARIESADAAIPIHEGRHQPLCALYRASAFDQLRKLARSGERRVQAWMQTLRVETVLSAHLGNPSVVLNVNTREELDALSPQKG